MRKGFFYTVEDYMITREGEVINKHNGRTDTGIHDFKT